MKQVIFLSACMHDTNENALHLYYFHTTGEHITS